MDLAQRVRRAILIVAEKYTRAGRFGQCAVAGLWVTLLGVQLLTGA